MEDGSRSITSGLVAREIHWETSPGGKLPSDLPGRVLRESEILVNLNDTETNLLTFIRQNVNYSHRDTLEKQVQILYKYKRCFGIEWNLGESDSESAKRWIRQKRFICWKLWALFDVAFPNKKINRLSAKKIEEILVRVQEAEKPDNVILAWEEWRREIINHIGIVWMTQDKAKNFMRKVIADLVE